MNNKDKAKLHTRLKLIKEYLATDPSKLDHRQGICYNLDHIKEPHVKLNMDKLFLAWPQSYVYPSGIISYTYPVGGMVEFSNDRLNSTMWTNPKRLALLDWLIEESKP